MSKTTKRTRPISKTIMFQQHQPVEDLTIKGKNSLTDFSYLEREGEAVLTVKADPDKINNVTSVTPFITTETTTANEKSNDPKKNIGLNVDYSNFNLTSVNGDTVKIEKDGQGITLDLQALTDKIAELEKAKTSSELKVVVTDNGQEADMSDWEQTIQIGYPYTPAKFENGVLTIDNTSLIQEISGLKNFDGAVSIPVLKIILDKLAETDPTIKEKLTPIAKGFLYPNE